MSDSDQWTLQSIVICETGKTRGGGIKPCHWRRMCSHCLNKLRHLTVEIRYTQNGSRCCHHGVVRVRTRQPKYVCERRNCRRIAVYWRTGRWKVHDLCVVNERLERL